MENDGEPSEADVLDEAAVTAPGDRAVALWTWPVATAAACWVLIALSFLALEILMRERPQFVGQRLPETNVRLLQASPEAVLRKVRDDVSVFSPVEAAQTDITIHMRGRRDYRGLRTILDMSGEFRGKYTITNPHDETIFVLFKCPHPRAAGRAGQDLNATGLDLDAGEKGMVENTANAWFWSGAIAAGDSQPIVVSYRVSRVRGATYQVRSNGGVPRNTHRVEIRVDDLPAIRFASGDGNAEPDNNGAVWERRHFLAPEYFEATITETRNLYTALNQLLEVGPVVSLLFMVGSMAVVFTRRRPTPLQVATICAGYAFYFPLILYLSAKFTFPVALAVAFVVPGDIVLPAEFHTQVESSGLGDLSDNVDLSKFGDYGQVLESRDRISLGRRLVPPGPVMARVKYYQHVVGLTDDLVGKSSE